MAATTEQTPIALSIYFPHRCAYFLHGYGWKPSHQSGFVIFAPREASTGTFRFASASHEILLIPFGQLPLCVKTPNLGPVIHLVRFIWCDDAHSEAALKEARSEFWPELSSYNSQHLKPYSTQSMVGLSTHTGICFYPPGPGLQLQTLWNSNSYILRTQGIKNFSHCDLMQPNTHPANINEKKHT